MSDKSKHFPEQKRLTSARTTAELFDTSEPVLANQRSKGIGFPYLRMGGKIIYDLDVCYEYALSKGSGVKAA